MAFVNWGLYAALPNRRGRLAEAFDYLRRNQTIQEVVGLLSVLCLHPQRMDLKARNDGSATSVLSPTGGSLSYGACAGMQTGLP